MNVKRINMFLWYKYDFSIFENRIANKIKISDFLVSDNKCTHRLIGLRYDHKTMSEPEITIICNRDEMAVAKKIAFDFGKKIYHKTDLSAQLIKMYYISRKVEPPLYKEIAVLYSKYFHGKRY